jgi:hypothetical protein
LNTQLNDDFWPPPLRHCGHPLLSSVVEEVTIGEISGEPVDGFQGNRMLFTALVPLEDVDVVLKTVGGIGHGVSLSSVSSSGEGNRRSPVFSIQGPGGSQNFESLVHSWRNHNKTVLLPDSAFLAQYGLVPRSLRDGSISWDALDEPTYDVVRVVPISAYSAPREHTTARIVVRRDYLEDYLSLKGCAAVVTFWDERFSLNDPEVAKLIGKSGSKFAQPGREMWFLPMQLDKANQVSQVWGCALLLKPSGQPVSDPAEPELSWPDLRMPVRGTGRQVSFGAFESAYVNDEVLMKFEKRSEFDISPEEGFVSYDGRWSVSYCRRIARNSIELELRKLYEGASVDVIKHYNKFAISKAVAERDSEINGTRHVGLRARDLVQRFLAVTSTLTSLCDGVGLSFTQEDVGQLSSKEIAYKGWWTIGNLKPLGHVIPMTLAFPDFLGRCTEIFKLVENLRPAPLRQVLIHLGLKKEDINQFGSLKLLATVSQLASICGETGLDLISDREQLSGKWDATLKLAPLNRLFALNILRTSDAHNSSSSAREKNAATLEVFKIDEAGCHDGWGRALDRVYDQTSESLEEINRLIAESWS